MIIIFVIREKWEREDRRVNLGIKVKEIAATGTARREKDWEKDIERSVEGNARVESVGLTIFKCRSNNESWHGGKLLILYSESIIHSSQITKWCNSLYNGLKVTKIWIVLHEKLSGARFAYISSEKWKCISPSIKMKKAWLGSYWNILSFSWLTRFLPE